MDAGNKDEAVAADKAIAYAIGNRFYVPLDFELLESHMPFYQSALGDRLEYELTFSDYSRVIQATGDADASYDIENISLEYDIVTQPAGPNDRQSVQRPPRDPVRPNSEA